MTPEVVAPHVNSRTGAIVVVRIFGFGAPVAPFADFGVPADIAASFAAAQNSQMGEAILRLYRSTPPGLLEVSKRGRERDYRCNTTLLRAVLTKWADYFGRS
jgi:hypothetical protein